MRKLLIFSSFLLLLSCDKSGSPSSSDGSNGKPVGVSARDILSATTYASIKIEIDYMTGCRPTATAINNLKAFINSLTNKPSGITFIYNEIPDLGRSNYSLNDILAIEENQRSNFNNGNSVGIYFLFVNGSYTQQDVLGVAYKNTSMCIFEKTIKDNSGALLKPSTEKLESTVIQHEFGHILGLVDVGSPMQTDHKDEANGNHCNNSSCLMYYQVETTNILANLLNTPVPTLDANCKADLKANGGK